MRRPRQLLLVPVLLALGACTLLDPVRRPPENDAERRLARGLSALEAGNHGAAFDDLAWVSTVCSGRATGSQALVALAALELDPRNRTSRPAVGSDLLGRVIQDPGSPQWVRALAETSYLMGLSTGMPEATPEVGGTAGLAVQRAGGGADDSRDARSEEDEDAVRDEDARAADDIIVYGCGPRVDAGDWMPPALPRPEGPSLVSLVSALEVQRDSATAHAQSLAQELATTRTRLEETERELERIRKTLKP